MMRFLLTAGILVATCSIAVAQLNFKAGYRANFTNPEAFNQILADYDPSEFDEAVDYEVRRNFGELGYLHGFDLGFRHSFENVGFEASWMQKRRQLRQELSISPGPSNTVFTNYMSTVINIASVGMITYIGPVGLEATIDYNAHKFKGDFSAPVSSFQFKDEAWSSHFSLNYDFPSKSVISMSIQPFVQVYWSSVNLSELDQLLNPTNSPRTILEKFNSFGIAFIIYNGAPRKR